MIYVLLVQNRGKGDTLYVYFNNHRIDFISIIPL